MQPEIRFATVEIHLSPWDAEVCRALLQSEGIPAFLTSAHHIYLQWPMSLTLGGVRVAVPADCQDSARELLAQRDLGLMQAALEQEWPTTAVECAACGGTQFVRKRHWAAAIGALAMLWLWAAPFPPGKLRECKSCGVKTPW